MDSIKKYEVKSLARALDVIEVIGTTGMDGVGITEIARQVGTTKSNAFGIVQTLCDRGFVSDSGEGPTRRYRLGPSFLRLGNTASSQSPLAVVASSVLARLTADTGMTSRFAVFDRGAAVAIVRQNAPTGVEVAPYLGRRELLHASGVGKALLAGLSDDSMRQICRNFGLERRTRNTITDLETLIAEITAVRQTGFAIDDEEDIEGVFCVAASVLDQHGGGGGYQRVRAETVDRQARGRVDRTEGAVPCLVDVDGTRVPGGAKRLSVRAGSETTWIIRPRSRRRPARWPP
jgi:IclR family transcriptional regulator, acetate operon repressor